MLKGYDPVALASQEENKISRNQNRKYYRFRSARFYGGIATADCVGCCLRCRFCWSWKEVIEPHRWGKFYAPEQVSYRLSQIASKSGYHQVRISGNEPTLHRDHLLEVLNTLPKDLHFILETNGILLGYDRHYAQALSSFSSLHVRVSLKGCSEDEFHQLTGAVPQAYLFQLVALENLLSAGVACHPAAMISFSSSENLHQLKRKLKAIYPKFYNVEIEELILYPSIEKRLKECGTIFHTTHKPDSIPPEQI
jgi:uncharacterized Fe-S cluster-containing radical SAM superfamily protein